MVSGWTDRNIFKMALNMSGAIQPSTKLDRVPVWGYIDFILWVQLALGGIRDAQMGVT